MKLRILITTGLLATLTVSSFALSTEHTQWGQGPAQFLMTKEEAARWKSVKTDEEAKAFIDLFWARRDPTPSTARNEYRDEFETRVDNADKNFASSKRVRGSMSDRGKTLVLYGQPKRVERATVGTPPPGGFDETKSVNSLTVEPWLQWTYESDDLKDVFGNARATIRFTDRLNNGDYKIERGNVDLSGAQQRMIARVITQPDLTVAPTFTSAAPGPTTAVPVAETPTLQTELTTESLNAAVAELKTATKNPYDRQIFANWGEFVTPAGTYFVPVVLYVPKSTGLTAAQSLTFFGVVEDESGKNVLAFEQPATLVATKDDFYIDRTLTFLPGGKNRGFFGLAENGKPLALVATDMRLAGSLDKDASAISSLLLSNNIFPLKEAQQATDPFAFGGVKVIPKADKTFRASDELWYFFELRHPGIAEAPVSTTGTVPVTTPEGAPKIQVKIDIEGTHNDGKKMKMAAPPAEVAAIAMKGVPGHYGVGSAILLESFKPGDYTFAMKVIDTVKKTSYTLSEKFKVVE